MEATLWPYGKCEKCANKNYCAWSESEILNCMNNGYSNFSPMRNADKLRAMSDEELAHFLEMKAGRFVSFYTTQAKSWLDWLKQEVKE